MVKADDELIDAVLGHVGRYRLTLPRLLAKTGLLASKRESSAAQLLEKLAEERWLGKAALLPEADGAESYYHLTSRAAKRLGLDPQLAGPLKRDVRIECYAVASFCCSGGVFRQLFTKQEFIERFKNLWYPGQPVRYYLEPTPAGRTRLAYLKVDKDGPGRWDRLIDSCARFLRQRTDVRRVSAEHRRQTKAFEDLVKKEQFQISVLTALPEKKRAIELELARRVAAKEQAPPLVVYVVPGLFDLVCPSLVGPGARQKRR